jgi:hypothetical protein
VDTKTKLLIALIVCAVLFGLAISALLAFSGTPASSGVITRFLNVALAMGRL